jgi:hypothetical protein
MIFEPCQALSLEPFKPKEIPMRKLLIGSAAAVSLALAASPAVAQSYYTPYGYGSYGYSSYGYSTPGYYASPSYAYPSYSYGYSYPSYRYGYSRSYYHQRHHHRARHHDWDGYRD